MCGYGMASAYGYAPRIKRGPTALVLKFFAFAAGGAHAATHSVSSASNLRTLLNASSQNPCGFA